MPVLTKKEYNQKKARNNKDKAKADLGVKTSKSAKPKEKKVVYTLVHPENGVNDLINFEDVFNIEGKDYKAVCENGRVITTEKTLANFLLASGYYTLIPKEDFIMTKEEKAKAKAEKEEPKPVEETDELEPEEEPKDEPKNEPKNKNKRSYEFKYIGKAAVDIADYESTLDINGIEHKIKCVKGMIKTSDEAVASILAEREDLAIV